MPPKVVVTLAAYNEAENIPPVIAKIRALGFDCIVVDDGSKDATALVAEEAGAIVCRHKMNMGQGYAFVTGLKLALKLGYDIIVSMDADGQHRPEEIPRFLERFETTHADVVIGSRVLGQQSGAPFLRRVMLPYVTAAVNRLSGYKVSDAMCGFRSFRARPLLRALPMFDAMLEPQYIAVELFIRFGRAGLSIGEVPVSIDPRGAGVSSKGLMRYGMGILKAAVRTMIEVEPRGQKAL